MITLTRRAAAAIRQHAWNNGLLPDHMRLRIAAVPTETIGLTYSMDLTDFVGPCERELISNGIRMLIDSNSLRYLRGVQVDFIEVAGERGFIFHHRPPHKRPVNSLVRRPARRPKGASNRCHKFIPPHSRCRRRPQAW